MDWAERKSGWSLKNIYFKNQFSNFCNEEQTTWRNLADSFKMCCESQNNCIAVDHVRCFSLPSYVVFSFSRSLTVLSRSILIFLNSSYMSDCSPWIPDKPQHSKNKTATTFILRLHMTRNNSDKLASLNKVSRLMIARYCYMEMIQWCAVNPLLPAPKMTDLGCVQLKQWCK